MKSNFSLSVIVLTMSYLGNFCSPQDRSLEAKTWVLGVLTASGPSQQTELGNIHTVPPPYSQMPAWRVAHWLRFIYNPIDAQRLSDHSWTCTCTERGGKTVTWYASPQPGWQRRALPCRLSSHCKRASSPVVSATSLAFSVLSVGDFTVENGPRHRAEGPLVCRVAAAWCTHRGNGW